MQRRDNNHKVNVKKNQKNKQYISPVAVDWFCSMIFAPFPKCRSLSMW